MKGKFYNSINNNLLFRLVELFYRINKLLNSNSSNDIIASKIRVDFNETKRLIAEDVNNYIQLNLFTLAEVRQRRHPKQFIQCKSNFNFSFVVCLN